jgi:hypothetical protein
MSGSPMKRAMDEMFEKLAAARLQKIEAEEQISGYTAALKAMAKMLEDKEAGDSYLVRLDELSGKPGFTDAVRYALRFCGERGATPTGIKSYIVSLKKMDLSVYSNPMASIHTTIRRMKESGDVEEFINDRGEKAYRLVAKKGRLTRPPEREETIISPPAPGSFAAMDAEAI